jgi:hypothetical protein
MMSAFCLMCSASPRYQSGGKSIPSAAKKQNKDNKKLSINKTKKVMRGISSYYGPNFHGKLTANGEIFDMYGVTAAHKDLPFNTYVRVTNENNGKSDVGIKWKIFMSCSYAVHIKYFSISSELSMKIGSVIRGNTPHHFFSFVN